MIVMCLASRLRIVNELVGAGHELDNLTCGLFLAGFVPAVTDNLTLVQASECNFSGYAQLGPVVWTGAYLDSFNNTYAVGQLFSFAAAFASPFVGNSVGGYFTFNGGNLRGSELLVGPTGSPTPIPIVNQFNVASIIPKYYYGS